VIVQSGRAWLRVVLATAIALLAPATAQAKDEPALEPSSIWGMEYGDDFCMLYRSFGEGDDAVMLQLTQYVPNGNLKIIVAGKELRTLNNRAVHSQFLPDDEEYIDGAPAFASFGDDLRGVLLSHSYRRVDEGTKLREAAEKLDDEEEIAKLFEWSEEDRTAREREITHFRIGRGFSKPVLLRTGGFKAPMDAMRTCLDELVSHWGINVEAHRTLTRKAYPKESPQEWLKSTDYPRDMLRKGYAGIVDFRMLVDEQGKPTECIVQDASNPRKFAEHGCELLMKRGTFEPALDAAGKPIKSYWSNRVLWLIPRGR
jgi:hypothetical protein